MHREGPKGSGKPDPAMGARGKGKRGGSNAAPLFSRPRLPGPNLYPTGPSPSAPSPPARFVNTCSWIPRAGPFACGPAFAKLVAHLATMNTTKSRPAMGRAASKAGADFPRPNPLDAKFVRHHPSISITGVQMTNRGLYASVNL